MKRIKTCLWFALAAGLALCTASCPKEIDIAAGQDSNSFALEPLRSVLMNATFNGLEPGEFAVTGTGSPLGNEYGDFRISSPLPLQEGAGLFIEPEKDGNSLKIQHQGRAGGNVNTDLVYFLKNADVYNALTDEKVLLQLRFRLENTNGVYLTGPYVYAGAGGVGGGGMSGNQTVQSRTIGTGTFQLQINGVWETTPVVMNRWNTAEYLMDNGTGRFKTWLNGKQVYDGLFSQGGNSFGGILFRLNSYETTAYLDDITVSTSSNKGVFFGVPDVWTVTFDKNGGSTEASPQTMTVTTPATTLAALPAPPEGAGGFVFNGWNTQADGSGSAFTETTAVTGDIRVYAQWRDPNQIMVTFDKNHNDTGDGWTDASPHEMFLPPAGGALPSLPAAPARAFPGWEFDGWNTQADGGGSAFTGGTVTTDTTVYAQWKIRGTVLADADFSTLPPGPVAAGGTTTFLIDRFSFGTGTGSVEVVGDAEKGNVVEVTGIGVNTYFQYNMETINPAVKKAHITFSMKHNGSGDANIFTFYGTGASGNAFVTANFNGDGSLLRYNNGAANNAASVPAPVNEWHEVGLSIDYITNTYTICFNGGFVAGGLGPRSAGPTAFGTIAWYTNTVVGNSFRLADVKISYEE